MTDETQPAMTTPASPREASALYPLLAAPFDETFRDVRGGVELTYITGEQAIRRLNDVLSPGGWSFRVLEHGIHEQADEVWVLAELVAYFVVQTTEGLKPVKVERQQFGSQKVKRSRTSGTPLDIGFDLKGATTDALKKCASLIGVGLYLSKKEGGVSDEDAQADAALAHARAQPASPPPANVTRMAARQEGAQSAGGSLYCMVCDEPLTETTFRDHTKWTPEQLAGYGRRKHNRVLCMTHYREANDALKAASGRD